MKPSAPLAVAFAVLALSPAVFGADAAVQCDFGPGSEEPAAVVDRKLIRFKQLGAALEKRFMSQSGSNQQALGGKARSEEKSVFDKFRACYKELSSETGAVPSAEDRNEMRGVYVRVLGAYTSTLPQNGAADNAALEEGLEDLYSCGPIETSEKRESCRERQKSARVQIADTAKLLADKQLLDRGFAAIGRVGQGRLEPAHDDAEAGAAVQAAERADRAEKAACAQARSQAGACEAASVPTAGCKAAAAKAQECDGRGK